LFTPAQLLDPALGNPHHPGRGNAERSRGASARIWIRSNGSAVAAPQQVAPGADDDASGIAPLLEVLRIALASGWKPKRTVKFMGYAREEVGLRGSNAIATSVPGRRLRM
jgi:putative aminopeptidase FrvX